MKNYAQMKKTIEVLERIESLLVELEKSARCEYEVVSEQVTDEQMKSWKTGELLWEDAEHTIPRMVVNREYDYVPKETLTEDDEMTVKAIEAVRKALDKVL